MTLKVLSLFSGAGGADLALEAAGLSVAALCETDPHARAVLREHWPDVPLHGDVSELDGTQYRGKVDIVVGGSPCQDLSVAGKRAGLTEGSGTRSSLFYEQVRIWNESNAPYLIWENVKGAFSSSEGADFAAVLSAIVGRAVPVRRDGWTNAGVVAGPTAVAAWRLLDLQHFGVPQRRERIVVLAARSGGVDPAQILALTQSVSRHLAPQYQARSPITSDAAPRANEAHGFVTYDARGNGNGVVANTLAGDHQNRVTDYTALVLGEPEPRTLAFKIRGGVEVDSGGKAAGKGYLGSEELAFTIGVSQDQHHQPVAPTITMGAHPAAPGLNGQDAAQFAQALIAAQPGIPRRLMPIECERLMGWPDDWTRFGVNEKGVRYELADTPRYKLCGNGIGREWMEWIGLRLMDAEGLTASTPSITLDS